MYWRKCYFKCLVGYQVAPKEATTKAIESLLAKERSADHLLLAAVYAGDQGAPERAVELLL